MKKLSLIALLGVIIFTLPFAGCSQNTEKQKGITYTTLDVKKDYEVLKVITGYAEITASPTKDVFLKAYASAWNNLYTEAAPLKADAVVGIHVEFINSADNLRIIVYGTAVKYN